MRKARREYDAQFKRDAVALSREVGRTVSEVAGSLGISENLLYRWRRELEKLGEIAFSGNGNKAMSEKEKRIAELEKKLKDTELERDILKKAVAIFSKVQK